MMKRMLIILAASALSLTAAAKGTTKTVLDERLRQREAALKAEAEALYKKGGLGVTSGVMRVGSATYGWMAAGVEDLKAQSAVLDMASKKASQCLESSERHFGYKTGCVISLGGSTVVFVVKLVGDNYGAEIRYLGQAVAAFARYTAGDFKRAGYYLREQGIPFLPEAFQIVGFIVDYSGNVVLVSSEALSHGVYNGTAALAYGVGNLIQVPVALLQGQQGEVSGATIAGRHLLAGVYSSACVVIEVPGTVTRMAVAAVDVTVHQITGKETSSPVTTCGDQVDKVVAEILSGTYVPGPVVIPHFEDAQNGS